MCYSSSGNCTCSLWHRELMSLVLKIVARSPAAKAETAGESAFSSSLLQAIPLSLASPFLGHREAFLSMPLCFVCLQCQQTSDYTLLQPELSLDLVWHLQPLLCKRQRIFLLLAQQLGLPPHFSCWFCAVFPHMKFANTSADHSSSGSSLPASFL